LPHRETSNNGHDVTHATTGTRRRFVLSRSLSPRIVVATTSSPNTLLLPALGGPGSNTPSPLAAQRDVTSSRICLGSTEGCAS
jgi:hypothetical protein